MVLRPSGAHFYRMLYRVLRAVHTVLTTGRIVRSNLIQESLETAVSSEDWVRRHVRTLFKDCRVPNISIIFNIINVVI